MRDKVEDKGMRIAKGFDDGGSIDMGMTRDIREEIKRICMDSKRF